MKCIKARSLFAKNKVRSARADRTTMLCSCCRCYTVTTYLIRKRWFERTSSRSSFISLRTSQKVLATTDASLLMSNKMPNVQKWSPGFISHATCLPSALSRCRQQQYHHHHHLHHQFTSTSTHVERTCLQYMKYYTYRKEKYQEFTRTWKFT